MTAVVLGTARGSGSVAASTTIYRSPAGFSVANATEAAAQHRINAAGVLSNLYVVVTSNDRGTSTAVIRINGADGTQTFSITASTTGEFEDTTHTDTIASGDLVAIKLTTGAGGTTFNEGIWTLVFSATTNTYNHWSAGYSASALATTSTYYHNLNTDIVAIADAGTEANAQYKAKVAGTLKNLSVYVSAASSQAHTVRTRKNGANGAQSVSLTASTTGWFEDLVNTDTVAVDDLICNQLVTGSNITSLVINSITLGYETTGSASPDICGNDGGTLATSLTRYWPLRGYMTSRTAEVQVRADAQIATTYSLMAAYVGANSITATSTIRLRVNGANGNSVLSVGSSATGYFEDASNSDVVAATDELNYSIVTGGTGTTINVRSLAILSTVAAGVTVSPASVNATLTLLAPAVSTGVTVTPSALAAVLALGNAVASTAGSVTVTPSSLNVALALPTAAVSVSGTVTPSALSTTLEVGAATVIVSDTATPSVLSATVALIAPAVTTTQNVTITPAALAATLALGAATVQTGGNVTVSPASLTASLALPSSSVNTGVTVSPARVPLTVALPAPTTTVADEPAALNATLAILAPTVSTGTTIAPAALTAVLALGSATVSAGGAVTVSPSSLNVALSLRAPSVQVHAIVAPAVLGAVFDILAVSVSTTRSVTATPAALVAAIQILTPTVATPPNELPGTVGIGTTALGGAGIGSSAVGGTGVGRTP